MFGPFFVPTKKGRPFCLPFVALGDKYVQLRAAVMPRTAALSPCFSVPLLLL